MLSAYANTMKIPELRRRIRATGLASGSTNRVRLTWALELEHAP